MDLRVCFIDDCFSEPQNKSRIEKVDLVGLMKGVVVEKFIPSDFAAARDKLNTNCELVFIDFKFDNDKVENKVFNNGSELVSLARSIYQDTPIYLLSVDISKDEEYERIQDFERKVGENFLSLTNEVYREIYDHQNLKNIIASHDIDNLLKALNCPEELKMEMKDALPIRVLKSFSTPSQTNQPQKSIDKASIGPRVEFYRWFIDYFYRYSGFLLDSQACAMNLGVTQSYFQEKVAVRLDAYRYDGIFSGYLKPRWWAVKLNDWIIDSDEYNYLNEMSFVEASAKILGAESQDCATCPVCNNLWPESLAYVDSPSETQLQTVHIRCSELAIDFNIGPYFRKPRIVNQ